MISKSKKINIIKDQIKRKKYIKNEIKKIILKSIIQNKNIKPLVRVYAFWKISQFKQNYFLTRQNNNICLYTGKIKSTWKFMQLSRHFLKN